MKLELRRNLFSVLAFVGLVWLVYLIKLPLTALVDLNDYGLQPRTLSGLVGIFTMPFLHNSMRHLLANTVPLTVLLLMLAMTRPNSRRVLICLAVLSGMLLWLIGPSGIYLGSSALVYAIAAYLIAAGVYERKPVSAATAILVGVLYGSLFWGLFPTGEPHVSWVAHLYAAVVGALFAHLTLRKPNQIKPPVGPGTVADSTSQTASSV